MLRVSVNLEPRRPSSRYGSLLCTQYHHISSPSEGPSYDTEGETERLGGLECPSFPLTVAKLDLLRWNSLFRRVHLGGFTD